ncbi:hypothetical protein [Stenotrophomonas mori]|uniref:Secreted protein n=1 Tax=Stenotrophomonas mori TaxID=2871096 RepID=A0ABT0SEA6_9GAMM|nr:hypothetical protein [Stenotrophomonas mori]MCL7713374.1 hypothetical protein [Stenotrophomonas mori]
MSPSRLSSLALLFVLVLAPAFAAQAQRTVEGGLRQQMSADEFRAAGLDKLSADELAALDAWLQGTVHHATRDALDQAREEGRQEVIVKNRGFFDFGSKEPIEARLEGEFRGFGKGRHYTLDNGQVWEQTDDASIAGVRRQAPTVRVAPGLLNVWYLQVDGLNTRAKVRRIR